MHDARKCVRRVDKCDCLLHLCDDETIVLLFVVVPALISGRFPKTFLHIFVSLEFSTV